MKQLVMIIQMADNHIQYLTGILHEEQLVTARKRSLGQGNIFTPVCHSVHRGRGHAWLLLGGMRGCSLGGMHGCSQGGVHGCSGGGVCGCSGGGRAWLF